MGGGLTRNSSDSTEVAKSATATLRSMRVVIAAKSAAARTPKPDEPDELSCDWQFAWQVLTLAVLPVCSPGSWHDPCAALDSGAPVEWAYTMAVPWHARKKTAATPATKRRADLENLIMVRILVAQAFERKRCAAAGLIWIKVGAPEA